MSKPRLLDLFCGAGGAAKGYQRAGFYVVGIDIKPMPRYCGDEFHQGDALEYLAEHGREFDMIHASPPCQKFTTLQNVNRALGRVNKHHDLIAPVRKLLYGIGRPFIVENVQGSPLYTTIILYGASLGLPLLARHRHFEMSHFIFAPKCSHRESPRIIGVYGDRPDGRPIMGRREYRVTYAAKSLEEGREAMGIDWMEWSELTQAIPPAYTEFIGRRLLESLP